MTPLDQSSMKKKPQLPKADLVCGFDLNVNNTINVDRTLFAGQTMDVGNVHIWNADGLLYVEYSLDGDPEDVRFAETHLYVGEYEACPLNNSENPKIGHFPYAGEVTYEIPYANLNADEDGNFIVAAHAVVEFYTGTPMSWDEFAATIPTTAKYFMVPPAGGPPPTNEAYFWYATIGSETCGNFMDEWDGEYAGWCIDALASIMPNTCYESYLYSSYPPYGPEVLAMIEAPENLDNVNWLINQNFFGVDPGYTMGDIQVAIWELLNPLTGPLVIGGDPDNVGEWTEAYAQALVDMALVDGEGFSPNCSGDLIGVIVDPAGEIQPALIFVPFECEWSDQTAWMQGNQYFPGARWDWYQEFMPTCP